ncbi:hypothetical protein RP20_CCG020693 [Aedes albopictus]|nr:uncharacterized protein LOC109622208 [Aedes albopictus]KXJ71377.1 hypothetical protein RP20_CCG020693 [Aedes albopictus]
MMMIKSLFLVIFFAVISAENVEVNRGNVALMTGHRSARSPQQNNFQGFPNFAPPGFDASHIVSQNTDVGKNGFAQTTIYQSENGMGSSSTSFSRSGTTRAVSNYMTIILFLVIAKFIRN